MAHIYLLPTFDVVLRRGGVHYVLYLCSIWFVGLVVVVRTLLREYSGIYSVEYSNWITCGEGEEEILGYTVMGIYLGLIVILHVLLFIQN